MPHKTDMPEIIYRVTVGICSIDINLNWFEKLASEVATGLVYGAHVSNPITGLSIVRSSP